MSQISPETETETETAGCGTPGCADPNCTYGRDDDWPPVKKALWGVLMDEKLNAGHYIKAFDLIEKLHAAVLSAGHAQGPGQFREALEPFAKAAGGLASVQRTDQFVIWQDLTVGDLRRAESALSGSPQNIVASEPSPENIEPKPEPLL